MPNFFFKIDSEVLSILIDQIRDIAEELKDELAIEIKLPDNDPELLECWKYSLLEDLQADCRILLSLLENESFGQEPISLEIEFAEATLRACSAIRRKLRSTSLAEINDSEIESGVLNIAELAPECQKPYASYVFLAYVQETIIQSMQFA